jgi:peptidoglycan/xylan/chitin deacetylase (PgdA/CDA1 family)
MAVGKSGSAGEVVVMAYRVSALWRFLPLDLSSRMDRCLSATLEKADSKDPCTIFFRADDVAVPGANFIRLMDLFARYQVPLCLAVVPAWLTQARWQHLKRIGKKAPSLWCWHQHGWRHVNHEPEGKKQEFGPSRPCLEIRADLIRGKHHLQTIMGESFSPVFTPPWNRCDQNTLGLLKELNYRAVSRSKKSVPPSPRGLPDFAVSVDLHTRKEDHPLLGWEDLFSELGSLLSQSPCGIMIHHQRMNEAAFVFLEMFLQALIKQRHLHLVHFMDLHAAYKNKDSR